LSFRHVVPARLAGQRLDAALTVLEPALSRSQARRLIESGAVAVDGAPARPARRLRGGEVVAGAVPPPLPSALEPEPIALDLVYQDEHLAVIDKPAGLVVHPAPGHARGTLVHALLHHCPQLSGVGGVARPGIVHRLDKGTSGLLVVAKTDPAHRRLSAQFKEHSIEREYLALVRGAPRAAQGTVSAAIGRHPTDRKRFSTRAPRGRSAVTHWSVEERLRGWTLLRVRLETGRTHQIRVHLASIGLPVAGDPVYGRSGRSERPPGLERPALHAALLGFEHPASGARLRFRSALPPDLAAVLRALRRAAEAP
jgi:23S rRNA pseudouridine1911/1915/1917 synthase